MKKVLKWGCLLLIVVPIILLVLAGLIVPNSEEDIEKVETKKTIVEKPNVKAVVKKEILPFSNIKFSKVGLKTENRATQKIRVISDTLPSEIQLKDTAFRIWNDNKSYSEFTVFIYLEGMSTDYGAYCIIEFDSKKMTDFIISESSLYDTKWEIK